MGRGGYNNGTHYFEIKKTIDQGISWDTQYSTTQYYGVSNFNFIDILNGWAVGGKGSLNTYLILKTTDSGENWEEQSIAGTPEPSRINCVYFVNDTIGWIGVGEAETFDPYGAIYFTNDGGENWLLQQNFESAILDIQMLNQDTGWAVGGDFIYNTTNGTLIVGIEEESKEQDFFTIIPNPTNGIFTINTNNKLSIINYQLTDITGKEILNLTRRQVPLQIDISSQPSGVYFITFQYYINNKINFLTKKIIKL